LQELVEGVVLLLYGQIDQLVYLHRDHLGLMLVGVSEDLGRRLPLRLRRFDGRQQNTAASKVDELDQALGMS
jgi:hypothetical protein